MPTFNRGYCIGNAIESVINQTFKNWELIIVDNSSTDKTIELINEFNEPRIKIINIKNNGVIAKSRNNGIKCASGDYIAFLDSDDSWKSTKLQESIKYIEIGYDLIYHDLEIKLKNKSSYEIFKTKVAKTRKLKNNAFSDMVNNGNAIVTSSVVMRREVLIKTMNFSESEEIIGSEDYDLWLRIAENEAKFFRINEKLGYYFQGNNTSSPEKMVRSLNFIRDRYRDKYKQDIFGKSASHWYEMGKCYYKLGKFDMSKECFLGSIKNLNINLIALRAILYFAVIKIKNKWI